MYSSAKAIAGLVARDDRRVQGRAANAGARFLGFLVGDILPRGVCWASQCGITSLAGIIGTETTAWRACAGIMR